MLTRISDWLDERTGYKALVHHALNEEIAGGARFMRGAAILQHRTKVEHDAAQGLVVIVRPRSADELETEYLPNSNLEWTVARAAAPWRQKLQAKR